MQLHDIRSHHAAKDLAVEEVLDQYGQVHPLKARGMRLVNIYELIRDNDDVIVWLEDPISRQVVWKSWLVKTRAGKKRTGPYSIEQIEYLHKSAYPHCRLVVWEGGDDGSYIMWREATQ